MQPIFNTVQAAVLIGRLARQEWQHGPMKSIAQRLGNPLWNSVRLTIRHGGRLYISPAHRSACSTDTTGIVRCNVFVPF
jgi:hypothetical protein